MMEPFVDFNLALQIVVTITDIRDQMDGEPI